jgi:hypothetical protein
MIGTIIVIFIFIVIGMGSRRRSNRKYSDGYRFRN